MSIYQYKTRQEVVGSRGERLISILLSRYIKENNLHAGILENYCFKTSYGSCEIDRIFVCNKGIFVIEVKQWLGKVFGDKDGYIWTHSFYKSGRLVKMTAQNPVIQNHIHCEEISKLFAVDYPIHSIVVFIKADISDIDIPNVVGVNDFLPYLKLIDAKDRLSDLDIDSIIGILDSRNVVSQKEHINNVRK